MTIHSEPVIGHKLLTIVAVTSAGQRPTVSIKHVALCRWQFSGLFGKRKSITTVVSTSTASPFRSIGLNFHWETASKEAVMSNEGPFLTSMLLYQSVAPNYAGHRHLTLHVCQSCRFGIGWSNNLDGVRGEEFATKSHPIVDYLLSACRRNNYHATEQGSDVSVSHDDLDT